MAKIHPAIAGRVMEENEKLRGLLFEAIHCCPDEQLRNEMKAALTQQAEPDHVEDMRAMVEPAPAQGEREAKAWPALAGIGRDSGHPRAVVLYLRHEPSDGHLRMIQEALRTRPAQTEQQPCSDTLIKGAKALLALDEKGSLVPHGIGGLAREVIEKLIARVEHTAPQPEQSELVEELEQFEDNGSWRYYTCIISRDAAKDALVAKDETP